MKKKVILGLGVSGKAVALYLLQKGEEVICVDKNGSLNTFDIPVYGEDLNVLDEASLLIKSPGIDWKHPLVQEAQKRGIAISSEMEIALEELSLKKGKKLLAISGSNGKTTTTLMTTHVLNRLGKKAIACGNVGTPLISQLQAEEEIFVVELSSFQLETLQCQVFDAAALLNISPNHLDRHAHFEEYVDIKLSLQKRVKSKAPFFVSEKIMRSYPKKLDQGIVFSSLTLRENQKTPISLKYRDGSLSHDFENCEAAFSLVSTLGVREEEFWQALEGFKKPPHRLEWVKEVRGVTFINDSKATTTEAVMRAVSSMPGDVILLAGGVDKGGNYKEWAHAFPGRVKRVVVYGAAKELIASEISPHLEVEKVESLEEATKRAFYGAKRGETVLLSPGCSSYDQFKNYEQRGETFKQLVHSLGE